MSALNHTDFQCLQDQLVDLKAKNYELEERNRRSQADFEVAKAKICSLQLRLEEQERDFQLTSSTLRREIENAYNNHKVEEKTADSDNRDEEDNYKIKYKKLLHKAKELQQRYDKSLEVVQQMDHEIKSLNRTNADLEQVNSRLVADLEEKDRQLSTQQIEYEKKLSSIIQESESCASSQKSDQTSRFNAIQKECDIHKEKALQCYNDLQEITRKFEQQIEEKKIQEKRASQMIKELKRQLASEKSENETLQRRLENFLSSQENSDKLSNQVSSDNVAIKSLDLSTSSSSASVTTNGNGSWSLVPAMLDTKGSKSNQSISSIDLSDDRETLQRNNVLRTSDSGTLVATSLTCVDAKSESDSSNDGNQLMSGRWLASNTSNGSPNCIGNSLNNDQKRRDSSQTYSSTYSSEYNNQSVTMPLDEQAALMGRLTRLQHDKWTLEEKLSYLEQSNAALNEELANKSDIIRHYFLNQVIRSQGNHQQQSNSSLPSFLAPSGGSSKMSSLLPSNINQILTDKSSLKRVVEFLKERSQQVGVSSDSENVTREATRKMQVMLEETLIKCIKLEENLDFVTKELNKLKN